MDISIFKVIGPVMIGPSSSHTAGAARLGRVAAGIVGGAFDFVSFGLHGSFAKTYRGHGTDRALVAGVLGIFEDDERLKDSFELAEKAGIGFEFYPIELENAHENTVKLTFSMKDGEKQEIIGSSLGGGQIAINSINGFETEISASLSTLVISQNDRSGVISEVSGVLAKNGINIGTMRVSRLAKGLTACCIIETDGWLSADLVDEIKAMPNILSVRAINVDDRGAEACTSI